MFHRRPFFFTKSFRLDPSWRRSAKYPPKTMVLPSRLAAATKFRVVYQCLTSGEFRRTAAMVYQVRQLRSIATPSVANIRMESLCAMTRSRRRGLSRMLSTCQTFCKLNTLLQTKSQVPRRVPIRGRGDPDRMRSLATTRRPAKNFWPANVQLKSIVVRHPGPLRRSSEAFRRQFTLGTRSTSAMDN
ncbi:hypothetical protein BCR43DRAFT_500016 [Syncephalastrum racemosum]|uniref:Uncharacterized protein n=1 Tax=Syncephalastrum racemosum TaxID=13706 RepID=A0A1X2GZG7_SYNRA|nr:hypothetical protein BCR43DRAFT_500016 [Syncephalastrum racemosum]